MFSGHKKMILNFLTSTSAIAAISHRTVCAEKKYDMYKYTHTLYTFLSWSAVRERALRHQTGNQNCTTYVLSTPLSDSQSYHKAKAPVPSHCLLSPFLHMTSYWPSITTRAECSNPNSGLPPTLSVYLQMSGGGAHHGQSETC